MPTNANTYNSRVTDEALEKKFRDSFKSQSGAELVDDLFASGVIVPTIDFTSAVGGAGPIGQNLQTAWDFATGHTGPIALSTATLITNTGFWKVDLTITLAAGEGAGANAFIFIDDGATTKTIWRADTLSTGTAYSTSYGDDQFVVFLRSGDSLKATSSGSRAELNVWYRQIADINGNLVDPLGFTSS